MIDYIIKKKSDYYCHTIPKTFYTSRFSFIQNKEGINIPENIDYKKIGIEKILDNIGCNDENILEMIGKVHNLKTDPNVKSIALRPPTVWHDGVGPQTYTDYTIFTEKPTNFKYQEEFMKANGFPEPDVRPGHITLVPDYNEYYKYHFVIKTKEGKNQLFVIDFYPLSDKPIKTMHLQHSCKGLYEVLFQDLTKGDLEMQKKISKIKKSSKVIKIESKEPSISNNFILSDHLVHTKEPLSLKEQEAILKKYKLPEPIAKPDHPDFKNNPYKEGFYFRNDDWIQIFIVRFGNFKILKGKD